MEDSEKANFYKIEIFAILPKKCKPCHGSGELAGHGEAGHEDSEKANFVKTA